MASFSAPRTDNTREITRWYDEVSKRLSRLVQTHSVTVTAGGKTGSSTADTYSVGGTLLGYLPTGNQDQFVDNIVINANGSVTVTLAANATADNTYSVNVLVAW